MQPVAFAPSILSADFADFASAIRLIEAGQPEWLHIDVMDGHFVPNLTIGPPAVKALKRITDIPLDVHLMISNPEEQLDWYLEAGADLVTVHLEIGGQFDQKVNAHGQSFAIEEVSHPEKISALLSRIRTAGRKAGLSLNPGTPVELALPFLDQCDLVLVMSVHPGFGGQSFIESSLEKLERIASEATATSQNPNLLIEVDGGINTQTAPATVAAGANLLVAGNAIFGNPDPLAALAKLRMAAGV
ncbi:MAG: ribulose-phosphate 3-epimerase [Coriobacteriales bacterium]|jgi:ribulose-phosphate 3-epimerase|nr:ribulose-phosphate 3-epimerase [Coriobacteriales bacterium]